MARTKVATIQTSTKNLIINSDYKLAQRGTSLATTGGGIYLLDRWQAWTSSAASVSSGQQSQSSLPASFPGIAPQNEGRAHRLFADVDDFTQSSSFLRRQRIESTTLRDRGRLINNVSCGVWVHANNMQTATIQIFQASGGASADDFSAITLVDQRTINISESTWTFLDIEDVNLISGNGIELRISLGSPAANVFTDTYITEVMMNEGPVVERFSTRGKDEVEELVLCQRYFEKSYRLDVLPGAPDVQGAFRFRGPNLTTTQFNHVSFNTPKRLENPTITLYSTGTGAAGFMRDEQGGVDAAGGQTGLSRFRFSARTTGTVGGSNRLISFHWTADAEL